MAILKVPIPQRSSGEQYGQHSVESADASGSGITLVAAVADCVAVIDYLMISAVGAETVAILAGTDHLIFTFNISAATPLIMEDNIGNGLVRSDAINEAITLVVSAGQMAAFVKFHYERQVSHR